MFINGLENYTEESVFIYALIYVIYILLPISLTFILFYIYKPPPHFNRSLCAQKALTVAPKKPNWDLKRDAAKQLERLDKQTQLAIVHLVRQRQLQLTDASS